MFDDEVKQLAEWNVHRYMIFLRIQSAWQKLVTAITLAVYSNTTVLFSNVEFWWTHEEKWCWLGSSKDVKLEILHKAELALISLFTGCACPMHLIGREISVMIWAVLTVHIRMLMPNCNTWGHTSLYSQYMG